MLTSGKGSAMVKPEGVNERPTNFILILNYFCLGYLMMQPVTVLNNDYMKQAL